MRHSRSRSIQAANRAPWNLVRTALPSPLAALVLLVLTAVLVAACGDGRGLIANRIDDGQIVGRSYDIDTEIVTVSWTNEDAVEYLLVDVNGAFEETIESGGSFEFDYATLPPAVHYYSLVLDGVALDEGYIDTRDASERAADPAPPLPARSGDTTTTIAPTATASTEANPPPSVTGGEGIVLVDCPGRTALGEWEFTVVDPESGDTVDTIQHALPSGLSPTFGCATLSPDSNAAIHYAWTSDFRQAVGSFSTAGGETHLFLWDGSTALDLSENRAEARGDFDQPLEEVRPNFSTGATGTDIIFYTNALGDLHQAYQALDPAADLVPIGPVNQVAGVTTMAGRFDPSLSFPSPDNDVVAGFAYDGKGDNVLTIRDARNTEPATQFTFDEISTCKPRAWVSNTSLICKAKDESVHLITLNSSHTSAQYSHQVVPAVENRYNDYFVVSPDGTQIAFTSRSGDYELFVVNVDGQTSPVLLRDVARSDQPLPGIALIPVGWLGAAG